jgi:WD40 repeat protein
MSTVVTADPDVHYHAFLSYSHAADGRLAPALQNAVQRFATPWYRLRSLRLFRDQTGLSASPGLWSAIETALSDSAWFVLFASPRAAESEWVGREVKWWLAHRDPRRLLILVTDGEFAWVADGGGSGRALGTAVPPVLLDALPEEPRWIDLRWVRSRDHVDQRDPRFREAAADLASALRGMPKDSLIGDDVRLHRRNRRLAAGTIAVLTALALVVTALVGVVRSQEAQATGIRAARAAAGMVAEADAIRERDPRTALQLDVAAHHLDPTPQTEAGLVQGLTAPFLAELPGHTAAVTDIVWSSDGARFATADGTGRVVVREPRGADVAVQVGPPFELGAPVERLAFTPDGARLAVSGGGRIVLVAPSGPDRTTTTILPGPSDLLATTPAGDVLAVVDDRLLRWAADGTVTVAALDGAGQVIRAVLSPEGRTLATATTSGVTLWDVAGLPRRLGTAPVTGAEDVLPVFDPASSHLLVGTADGTVTTWDIADTTTPVPLGQPARAVERTLSALAVSRDGRAQAAASIDGSITLTTPAETVPLRAHRTAPLVLAFSPDGTRLLSGALDGAVDLWDTAPGRGPALTGSDENSHSGALLTIAAPHRTGSPLATGGNDGVALWDVPGPGRLVRRPGRIDVSGAALALAFDADDRRIAVGSATGHVSVVDLADPTNSRRELPVSTAPVFDLEFFPDGSTLVTASQDGVRLVDLATGAATVLTDEETRAVTLIPDMQRLVVPDTFANELVLWDVTDRAHPAPTGRIASGHETVLVETMILTPAGTLASVGRDGKLVLTALDDPDHGHEVAEVDTARQVQTRDDAAGLLTVTTSPDGRLLAAAGEEGVVGVWDIADPSRPRQVGAPLLDLDGATYGLAFSADGLTLVAGGEDKRLAVWDVRPVVDLRRVAVATACRRAEGPLTAQAWSRLAPQVPYRDTCNAPSD